MAEIPEPEETEETVDVITDGYFEEEFYVSSEEAGEFLAELAEQLQESNELKVQGNGWEIPFAFGEPVEIEVQFQGDGPELEFEIELEGGADEDQAPEIS